MCEAREEAIQEMIEEAEELGANAVIGVKIDYIIDEFSGYYDRYDGKDWFIMDAESVWVIATGTAVWL